MFRNSILLLLTICCAIAITMTAGVASAKGPGKWKPFYKNPKYSNYQYQRYDLNKGTRVNLQRKLDAKTGKLRWFKKVVAGKKADRAGYLNLTSTEVFKGRVDLRKRDTWKGRKHEERTQIRIDKKRWVDIPKSAFTELLLTN